MKEFKSKAFAVNQLNDEGLRALKDDAEIICKVGKANFPQIIQSVKEVILAKTEKDELAIQERMISSGLVQNLQTAMSAYRLILYFFKIFNNDSTKNDSPEMIACDLISLGLKADESANVEILLGLIKQEIKWYDEHILKNTFERGLFPNLQSMGTTVELRAVFNREIEGNEKVEEYKKEVKLDKNYPVIPIISIAITLDSGTPSRFVFQASPEGVEKFIERLKASLLKATLLKEHYKSTGV